MELDLQIPLSFSRPLSSLLNEPSIIRSGTERLKKEMINIRDDRHSGFGKSTNDTGEINTDLSQLLYYQQHDSRDVILFPALTYFQPTSVNSASRFKRKPFMLGASFLKSVPTLL